MNELKKPDKILFLAETDVFLFLEEIIARIRCNNNYIMAVIMAGIK